MTKGQDFIKNAKFSHGHRSAMSNSAWCDLNKKCTVLKLHDMCYNPKCKSQKQITFSSNQFQLEGAGFKNTMKKIFKGTQSAWNNFLKPAINVSARLYVYRNGRRSQNKKFKSCSSYYNYIKEYMWR